MKKNIDKLNKLIVIGAIDLNDFYNVTVTKYDISLQGHFSGDRMKRYAKFDFKPDGNGYMVGHRNNVQMAFT